jgi:DNA-binding response OmpR family regulator
MLTRKGEEFDKLLGLEWARTITSQAVQPREVLARVKAVLRDVRE